MRRSKVFPPDDGKVVDLVTWAAKAQARARKKEGPRPTTGARIIEAFEETEAMRKSDDWSQATPRHFVALYALCHEHVYGTRPGELRGVEWTRAAGYVRKWLAEFSDVATAVDLVRWSWAREQRAYAKKGAEHRRMGWRLQFSLSLLTDYKVAVLSKRPRQQAPR